MRLRSVALTFLLLCVVVPLQVGIVRAEAFTDPIGDLFDNQGRPVAAEPYLGIVEVELIRSGTGCNVVIRRGLRARSMSKP